MGNLTVVSGQDNLKGEKIRYIRYKNINYVIFTLNEQDDEGYEKVYMNKIIDNEEDLISDSDWSNLKGVIPTIVKQIRNNDITDFEDLSLNDIEKLDLNLSKAFKLKINIVDSIKKEESEKEELNNELSNLLTEFSKEEKTVEELDNFLNNIDPKEKAETPVSPVDQNINEIEELRKELDSEKRQTEILQNKMVELEMQLEKYKNLMNKIKVMIEES